MFVNHHRDDWDDHLPYLMMAYRATDHENTKCSPNLIMFGREILCPVDLMFGLPANMRMSVCPVQYVEWVQTAMRESFQFISENLETAARRQKNYYDKKLKVRNFEPDTWVWRWYPPFANQSLGLGWTGPYLVLRKLSDVNYQIQRDENTHPIVVHVDQLKPYEGTTPPLDWRLFNDVELSESMGEESVPMETEPPATSTPVVTRTGRRIKPRERYSP